MTTLRNTELCRYSYDPLDQLIGHALPDLPVRKRFYCKNRLVTEIEGEMRYSLVQHGDQLLAQQGCDAGRPETTLLATDKQRSVMSTLKANQQQTSTAYSAYGHGPHSNGLLSLLGFNGERPDMATGCYLLGNGYRAFNPVLMRFNSPDRWSPFGKGGINAYAYCGGEPINRTDSTGHRWFHQFLRSVEGFNSGIYPKQSVKDNILMGKIESTLKKQAVKIKPDTRTSLILEVDNEFETQVLKKSHEHLLAKFEATKLKIDSSDFIGRPDELGKLLRKADRYLDASHHIEQYKLQHDMISGLPRLNTLSVPSVSLRRSGSGVRPENLLSHGGLRAISDRLRSGPPAPTSGGQ